MALSTIPKSLLKQPTFQAYAETTSAAVLPKELLEELRESVMTYDVYIYSKALEFMGKRLSDVMKYGDSYGLFGVEFDSLPKLIAYVVALKQMIENKAFTRNMLIDAAYDVLEEIVIKYRNLTLAKYWYESEGIADAITGTLEGPQRSLQVYVLFGQITSIFPRLPEYDPIKEINVVMNELNHYDQVKSTIKNNFRQTGTLSNSNPDPNLIDMLQGEIENSNPHFFRLDGLVLNNEVKDLLRQLMSAPAARSRAFRELQSEYSEFSYYLDKLRAGLTYWEVPEASNPTRDEHFFQEALSKQAKLHLTLQRYSSEYRQDYPLPLEEYI